MRLGWLPICGVLAACNTEPSEIRQLPHVPGTTYSLSIGTWRTGDHADEPFEIKAKGRGSGNRILKAEQCKSVAIGQSKEAIYIFYDFLALDSFLSQLDENVPPVRLCDLRFDECKQRQEAFQSEGTLSKNICSYSG